MIWIDITMLEMLPKLPFHWGDALALAVFLFLWLGFSMFTEFLNAKRPSLTHLMNRERAAWARSMYARELRIVDTNIMQTLQQGTAFFASTSIFALGGCFALLGSADKVATVLVDIAFITETTRASFEIKTLGLIVIFAFAFFKFGWSYRLFNYCAILVGATVARQSSEPTDRHVISAINKVTRFNTLAGAHFNSGLRAIFFSIAYVAWFISHEAMIVASIMVVLVLIRRQFFSAARASLLLEPEIFGAEDKDNGKNA